MLYHRLNSTPLHSFPTSLTAIDFTYFFFDFMKYAESILRILLYEETTE